MEQPLVSVIIPVYNRKEYIGLAIASVLAQTYKSVEIIVADDHSNQAVFEEIQKEVAKFPGVTLVRTAKNIGPAGAANRGIAAAKGKYIAILDDDDQWVDPKKLEKQVEFLEKNPDYVLTGGGFIAVNKQGSVLRKRVFKEHDADIKGGLLVKNPIAHSTVVFRKDAYDKTRGYPENISFGDWAFWLELGKHGKFYNFQEHFTHYLDHQGFGGMHGREMRRNLGKQIALKGKYKNYYPGYYRSIGMSAARYAYSFVVQDPSIDVLVFAYKKLFKEEISPEVFTFIKNLRFMIVGGFFAALLGIGFQSLAGRVLGPAEYGKYILINSITAFMGIPMVFGIDQALLKYNSEKEDIGRQRTILSTALVVFLGLSLLFGTTFLLLSPYLAPLFSVSINFFNLAIVAAFSILAFTFSAMALQGLHKITHSAVIKLLQKAAMLALLPLFVFGVGLVSYLSAIWALVISSVVIFVCVLVYLRNYVGFYFDRLWAEKLLRYGAYGVLSSIAGAISANFDKLVINRFLSPAEIGIYGAYSAAFIVPVFFLFGMFNAVFYPTVSRRENKMGIFNKVNKLIPLLFTVAIIPVVVGGFFILALYGKDYPFNLQWGILFGILAMLMCLAGMYGAMMGSVGRRGVRVTTIAGIALMMVNIALDLLLIPRLGIAGAAISLIVAYIVNIIIVFQYQHYFLTTND